MLSLVMGRPRFKGFVAKIKLNDDFTYKVEFDEMVVGEMKIV